MQVHEAFGSGTLSSGNNRSGERRYVVLGVEASDDEVDVRLAVEANAPMIFDGMSRKSVQVSQISNDAWSAVVQYSPSEVIPPTEYEEWITSFSTSGQIENVQLAIAQVGYSLIEGVAVPDYAKNVNVDADGIPRGIDIVVPKFEWSETHYLARSAIPGVGNQWLERTHAATGKTNASIFRGFAVDSVLFLGCSGSLRPQQGDWEVTFNFVASPAVTLSLPKYNLDGTPTMSSGSQATVQVPKKGHEYVWFVNQKVTDQAASTTVTRAAAVFRSQVYESVAFEGASGFMP